MTYNQQDIKRIVALDMHPDVFSAAYAVGKTATEAKILKIQDRLATADLQDWAKKNLTARDTVVLEASGNSFSVAKELHDLGLTAVVLESYQASKIRENYCNDDKACAVNLARVYLSGLQKEVWVPDEKTRQRHDILYAYKNSVKDSTRFRNRIRSYLSDHLLRLPQGTRLTSETTLKKVLKMHAWEESEKMIITQYFEDLWYTEKRRKQYNTIIAQEVLHDKRLRGLLTLLGVRHIVAFAIGAIIGNINRFPNAKKLVGYVGLAPGKKQSGNNKKGHDKGIGRFGNRYLRGLLIQSAQNALNQRKSVYHKWGWKLALKKNRNLATAAIARKMVTSIWHLLKGGFCPIKESNSHLQVKVNKLATLIGAKQIKKQGYRNKIEFVKLMIERILFDSCIPLSEPASGLCPDPRSSLPEGLGNKKRVELAVS